MLPIVDAWLERGIPQLRLLDATDGHTLFEAKGRQVEYLLHDAGADFTDLSHPPDKELVGHLTHTALGNAIAGRPAFGPRP